MRRVVLNYHDLGEMVARRVPCGYDHHQDTNISVVDEKGKLLGGVIFTDYTGASIAMHMAGNKPGWATPDLMWAIYHYPFEQLGCRMVLGYVNSNNQVALAIDRKMGFTEVARVPDVFVDGDLVILRMLRDECKYLSWKPRNLISNY